jgi:FAD/FMN-containing dehydrogenase/Fe-S oxidoreductase
MERTELPLTSDNAPVDQRALGTALRKAVTGEVRFDRISRALYSTDASVYQIVPLGVVLPKSEADVLATLRLCAEHGVPITARGGGTSQAGQSIGAGVQLDCSKYFHEILEVNAAERWVRVRPGCVPDELNRALKPHGLHFAPDISTSNRATIGGMIANNSSGTRSVVYGKTGDHVLELRVALPNGEVIDVHSLDPAALEAKCGLTTREGECYRAVCRIAAANAAEVERRFPRILRRVGGYNLEPFIPSPPASGGEGAGVKGDGNSHPNHSPSPPTPLPRSGGEGGAFSLVPLLVGSEGTLAVILEAKLRLVPLPKARAVLVVQFADLLDALAATPAALAHHPSAVEVIDRYILDSTKINPEASRLRDFLKGDPGAILIIELSGDSADELTPRLARLEEDLRGQKHGEHWLAASDSPTQTRIWKLRKLALGLSMAEKGDAKAISFVEDTAVAPERLRDYIAEFLQIIARHGTKAGVYAHASVGCLHVRPVIDLKTEAGVQQFEAIAGQVADLVLKYGGALSGEHGDGLVRSPFQEKMYGPALYQAFREIKQVFDPQGLLNPGKIVDAPPLRSNLRFGPGYFTTQIPTTFDFSIDGGITRSAELCAGVGECRKKLEGTMCPSYQATRDEQHSTRGRANALRLALTGQLGRQGLADPMLKDVLDLCLECKACKAECPTNTDMARLKAEFLHQYHRKHGLPRRNRIFGNVAALSRLGSSLAPVSNWLAQSGAMRWLNDRFLGIDRRRMPPPFASTPLSKRKEARDDGVIGRPMLLFPDTFTEYHEPEIGVAALRVLRRAGFQVSYGVPGRALLCCGRPLISNGLLTGAVHNAEHNVEVLYPWAAEGKPIIACEPSCILTIKDDYPALVRTGLREKAEAVAKACLTFEECLSTADLVFQPHSKKVLVQGHCHQQALVGMSPSLALLKRIPEAEVVSLEAGCCGMAGSFGYEKEHYEVSRLVGEQRLFPALRAASPDCTIIANGLSCRLQIQHFTGRQAVHPAVLLAELL